ncbi:hypothetical protein HU200_036783 [Digitaria exilis]|uniref:Uncharacterized protein n=1 Tax=Digitaria exilis TaxID=1010633 RepID=A0A835BQT7_9POAL|nr:hypothetical protein HU200_036783 [Digitaria exilis]
MTLPPPFDFDPSWTLLLVEAARLGLPSAGRAGHPGPRCRAHGDDAEGAGAAGAQRLLPPRSSQAAVDAPRPQRLWQVHPFSRFLL